MVCAVVPREPSHLRVIFHGNITGVGRVWVSKQGLTCAWKLMEYFQGHQHHGSSGDQLEKRLAVTKVDESLPNQ